MTAQLPITGEHDPFCVFPFIFNFFFNSMMVYIAELSTPLLNISWLINYLNFESSLPLTITGAVLVISFFFCRVLWGPWMLWHMYTYWTSEPRFIFQINVFIMIFFILLNFYWFYLLISLLFKSAKKEKKEIKEVKKEVEKHVE
jgi:hypothetical protein